MTDFKKSLVSVKYLKSIDPVCKLKKKFKCQEVFYKVSWESHMSIWMLGFRDKHLPCLVREPLMYTELGPNEKMFAFLS